MGIKGNIKKMKLMLDKVEYLQEELTQIIEFADLFEHTFYTKDLVANCVGLEDMITRVSSIIGDYKNEYRVLVNDELTSLRSKEELTLLGNNENARIVRKVLDSVFLLQNLAEKPNLITKL